MTYFVTREELLWEIKRAVDAMFSAVATCLSDDEKKFNKKFEELRNEFLLLINTVGRNDSHQVKSNHGLAPVVTKRGVKKMEERKFEEILKEMIDHILKGDDKELIILVDELEQSTEKFKEEKERIRGKLTEIREKTKAFLKQEEEDEKKKQD